MNEREPRHPEPPESRDAPRGADPAEPETWLEQRLREAAAPELLALCQRHAAELSPRAARLALANPFLSTEVVELLAAQRGLVSSYEVRREIARSRQTPDALALRFVHGLFWRDLVELGSDARVPPRVRRAADLELGARLPGLAVGEKISIARRASTQLLAQLRHDPSPMVISALLDNPRLTEGILAPLVHSERCPGPILGLIAADRRWGVRYGLRFALARNPATPEATALRLVAGLRKGDQKAVAADPRLSETVRRRARLLSGELRD